MESLSWRRSSGRRSSAIASEGNRSTPLYTEGVTGSYFFFSSRRRHTRYWRDWSSDVCSSDLGHPSSPPSVVRSSSSHRDRAPRALETPVRAVCTHPARPAAAACPVPSGGAPDGEGYPGAGSRQTPGHTAGGRGCRGLWAAVRWPGMNTSQESPTSGPAPVDDAGSAALVAALETSSTAIWCLAGPGLAPVWANARARDLGTATGDLAAVTGHRVAELAGEVARSGHAEPVHGAPDPDGRAATVVLQPLQVHGQPGVLVLVEADHTDCQHVAVAEGDVVDQVQHSLLPPALPLLPDVRLSGSYHRASSVHAAGGDWYDAVPLGRGRLALDRKSTRLNSSHANISYAVFCLKKKKRPIRTAPNLRHRRMLVCPRIDSVRPLPRRPHAHRRTHPPGYWRCNNNTPTPGAHSSAR